MQLSSLVAVTELAPPALSRDDGPDPSPRRGNRSANADTACFQVPSDQGDMALQMMRLVTQQE